MTLDREEYKEKISDRLVLIGKVMEQIKRAPRNYKEGPRRLHDGSWQDCHGPLTKGAGIMMNQWECEKRLLTEKLEQLDRSPRGNYEWSDRWIHGAPPRDREDNQKKPRKDYN